MSVLDLRKIHCFRHLCGRCCRKMNMEESKDEECENSQTSQKSKGENSETSPAAESVEIRQIAGRLDGDARDAGLPRPDQGLDTISSHGSQSAETISQNA